MRPKLSFVWFLVAVALGAILIAQWRGAQKREQLLQSLQLQVEKLDRTEKTAKARAAELEKENGKLRGEVIAAELEANRAKEAAAEAIQQAKQNPAALAARAGQQEKKPEGPVNFLAQMMKNPEMRQMMEQQQRMAMDMIYSPLIKQLNLSPEEAERFKELLFTNQMANINIATELMGEGKDLAEIQPEIAAQQQEMQEDIKSLLGEEKYQQFQEYNQTVGERVMLDQFGKQLELQPEQTEQLLSLFKEEKQNAQINQPVAPNFDANRDGHMLMADPGMMERFLAQQEDVNLRVLDRARTVLTPEQYEKFGPFLNNSLNMQKMGMKAAQQMAQPQPEGPVQ